MPRRWTTRRNSSATISSPSSTARCSGARPPTGRTRTRPGTASIPASISTGPMPTCPSASPTCTKWASNIPAAAAQIKANLKGPMPRAYIDMGVNTFGPMADFLQQRRAESVRRREGRGGTGGVQEAERSWRRKAFDDLDKYMGPLRKTQTEDFAMGAGPVREDDLRHRARGYAARRAAAHRHAKTSKRNQDALKAECDDVRAGQDDQECVAIEESHKPEGGDFVAYARKQLVDLRQFVIDHNVVTVPGEEEAMVKQSPPYNAQNGAYIDPSPPFAKNLPAFYNIAAPDPKWTKKEQQDYISGKANLLFTSVHEVWPGHFLQFLHSNRSESMFGWVYVELRVR